VWSFQRCRLSASVDQSYRIRLAAAGAGLRQIACKELRRLSFGLAGRAKSLYAFRIEGESMAEWRPMTELPIGHYAVGQVRDGEEADIYRASPAAILNCATGQSVMVTAWRPREHHHAAP
jgi:hypothetical protein